MENNKQLYRVKDWKSYNQILKQRWSLDLWLSPQVLEKWYSSRKTTPKRGAKLTYSREAILACLTLRALLNLSLRATEGLVQSLFQRLGLATKCPSYSQLCRRSESFSKMALPRLRKGKAFYLAVDSTGLKVYGQGEWHVKMHNASKRRTWRKLHIAIDPVTQELLAAELTSSKCGDSTMLSSLLDKITDPIAKLWADGAYDHGPIYQDLFKRGIRPIIPPRQGAKPCYAYYTRRHLGRRRFVHSNPPLLYRDQAINFIAQFMDPQEGKKLWKKSSGYGLRSLVETAIMRFKRTMTDKLRSRKLKTQQAEVKIKAAILNKMLKVGFPHTVPIPCLVL